jgi:hypothetical protein
MNASNLLSTLARAVSHAGKDVENRGAPRQFKAAVGCRVYIDASKGMTRVEYERAAEFMAKIGVECPAPDELQFGGVIGSALVVDIVARHRSRWFHGPFALCSPTQGRSRSTRRAGRWAFSASSRHDQDRPQRRGVRGDSPDASAQQTHPQERSDAKDALTSASGWNLTLRTPILTTRLGEETAYRNEPAKYRGQADSMRWRISHPDHAKGRRSLA